MMEEDRPRPKTIHDIGQDLSVLSIEELTARIDLLKAEIERLDKARLAKQAQRQAADSFFKAR